MRAVRRAPVGVLMLVWALLVATGAPTAVALLSGSANSTAHTLAGAVFNPLFIPAPVVTQVNGAPRLTWQSVSLSSGAPVSYAVTRVTAGGSTSAACPAPSVSVSGGQAQCDDTGAAGGATYSYIVQPYLERAGTVTWTRPASTVSNQVSIPRLAFGGVGPAALFSGNSPTVVGYPTDTAAGDLLIFVARNARNKQISPPSGWATLVSRTGANPASAFLVAWRVADSASSTTVSINSSNDGATAWIVRYRRTTGVTGSPVVAHAAVVSAQSAVSTASFSAAGLLTTAQGFATVVTIASIIASPAPSLVAGSGYSPQAMVSATSAGSNFSVSFADRLAVTAGSQVASPGWQTGSATDTWEALTLAFS